MKFARTLGAALALSRTPSAATPASSPPPVDLDTASLDKTLGFNGKANGRVYQFSIPRSEAFQERGMSVSPALGTAIAINFQPTGAGKAARAQSTQCLVSRSIVLLGLAFSVVVSQPVQAQASPELSMREFASSQVKKGVRSIGFGGDGATSGNYALVWKDAGSALVDYADTRFTNGNDFHFSAVGITSPSLWHDLAIYIIALDEGTNEVRFSTSSPGLGPRAVALTGTGSDHALFSKIALPLGRGLSAGVLLSYETSRFDAAADANPANTIHYKTEWRPSGGFGLTWQPNPKVLLGVRALLNSDEERRIDPAGAREGEARSQEYRLGLSVSPWTGALVDLGTTRLQKRNALSATHTIDWQPNVGFEQWLLNRRLAFRFGKDETSLTAGLSWKLARFDVGVAYVNNMAHARVGNLFGMNSRTLMMTVGLDYMSLPHKP